MQTPRPRKLTGRIISIGTAAPGTEKDDFGEEMPFRPAFDLLEEQERKPSAEDVTAIGLALFILTPDSDNLRSASWGQAGIFESAGRGIR